MRARSLVLGLLVALGCSSRGDAPRGTGSAASVTPPVGSATTPSDAAAPARPAGIDAAVIDDPAARTAYRAGMRTGRKATDAKRYADAIAGFDAALTAKPQDARALGERGYARLLEGADLDAATRDLDAAASGTKDPKLLSTIWFNRGLVHEKRGDQVNATASFAIANLMRPTKAAAAKLAGKDACPLEALRTFAVEDHPPVQAADWVALARVLPHQGDAVPATTEAALEALTESRTEPTLPAVITASTFDENIQYAVWRSGGLLLATPVGMAWYGRCPGNLSFAIAASTATVLHVRGSEEAMGGHTFMCEGKDELVECTGADDEVAAGTACLGGSAVERDLVIDRATGRVVLAVERYATGTARPIKIDLAGKELRIRGQGCERTEPL